MTTYQRNFYTENRATILVNDQQRDAAAEYLQQAFSEGRLSFQELDERLDIVLNARTGQDINLAFEGLANIAMSNYLPANSARPTNQVHSTNQLVALKDSHSLASLVYWLAPVFWLFAPGICYLFSNPGSFVRKASARAFNMLLKVTVICLLAWMIGDLFFGLLGGFTTLGVLCAIIFCAIGGARASEGELWNDPLITLPGNVLDENK